MLFYKFSFSFLGFYDLVWIPTSNFLVCSVYDTIQFWDMSSYSCVGIIYGETLDSGGVKSCCFAASDRTLFCGTDLGHIKVYDLLTANLLTTIPSPGIGNNRNFICDLKFGGDLLMAVDWHGATHKWKISATDASVVDFLSSFTPLSTNQSLSTQYTSRHTERRIEFNDVIVVTNVRQIFCIWDATPMTDRPPIFVNTDTFVLCSKVSGRFAFWGEQNGSVHQVRFPESGNDVERIGVVHSRFNDCITSLSVTSDVAVFGDKNGEISCVKLPISGKTEFVLESGHEFGCYVWAVQVDSVRIFSGDSRAKMVVHDFWNYDQDGEDAAEAAGGEEAEASDAAADHPAVKKLKADLD